MFRSALLLASLLAAHGLCSVCQSSDEPLTYSDLRGANYVPSYARNDVAIWMDFDPVVIDRELGFAKTLGLKCVRVFLQHAVYEQNPEAFLGHLETFLQLCEKHQVQMMPVVFDSCFGELPDLTHYRDKDWMACPGQNRLGAEHWPAVEKYVGDVLGRHRDDRRIIMWDVMNEPACTSYWVDLKEREKIWTFLQHMLQFAHSLQPTQPLTVGVMTSAHISQVADQVDVISFHNYTRNLSADIRAVKALGEKYGKPVVINEVVRRDSQPYDYAMPVLRQEKIGWVFWELMLGKTQFSREPSPVQGLVYPDGTCRDAQEVAQVMNIDPEEATGLFPERPRPVLREDGMVLQGFWTRWTGQGPQHDRLFYSRNPRDQVTFPFQGTELTLIHKIGPDCGVAQISIDGTPLAEPLDTYSATVDWNRRTVLAQGTHDRPPHGRPGSQRENSMPTRQISTFKSSDSTIAISSDNYSPLTCAGAVMRNRPPFRWQPSAPIQSRRGPHSDVRNYATMVCPHRTLLPPVLIQGAHP